MLAQAARVAALTVFIGCWGHIGAPIDAAVAAFLWAAISVCTEQRQGLAGCDHNVTVVAVSICFAMFTRETPMPTQLARSCTLLVGELMGGIAAAWKANGEGSHEIASDLPATDNRLAAEEPQDSEVLTKHRAQEPQTPPSRVVRPTASQGSPLADVPNAPATSQELTAADKRIFASQQFQATFRPVVGFLVAVVLVTVGLAVVDPATRTNATVGVPALITLISLRTWLHWKDDQQRARLLFGYGAFVLTTIIQINRYFNADGHMNAAVFLCLRAVLAPITAICGYSALPMSHRATFALIIAGANLVHPPFSEIGRPLEPIITCSALLLGTLLGLAVESHLISRPKQGTLLADFTNTPVASRELTTADERIFASQQFQAAFCPVVCFGVATMLVTVGLAAGDDDPTIRTRASVSLPATLLLISLRTWLHWMDDQQRARRLFGYGFIVLTTIIQINRYSNADGHMNAAVFLCLRAVLALTPSFSGYSALPMSHRATFSLIVGGASLVHPPLSEIGRPLEPIITCSALLLGEAVGFAIEDALWRSFKAEQAERRLRHEAQRQAREAEERQQAAEAEGVAFKLATAKANRTADSQLNHFIKGLCGSALNWLDLIKAGGYGEQCTRHAQCSIDLLKSAIEWTHHRQTLVSLADGTYTSQRSECDLPSFLAETLTASEGTVQVWRLTSHHCFSVYCLAILAADMYATTLMLAAHTLRWDLDAPV